MDWSRDDAAYFVMDRHRGVRPHPAPCDVLGARREEYRAARRDGGLFQLTMHPDLIARRSRIVILEALLEEMAADGDVWFASHAEIADHCHTDPEVGHVNLATTAHGNGDNNEQ